MYVMILLVGMYNADEECQQRLYPHAPMHSKAVGILVLLCLLQVKALRAERLLSKALEEVPLSVTRGREQDGTHAASA